MGTKANRNRDYHSEPQDNSIPKIKFHEKDLASLQPKSDNQYGLIEAYLNSDKEDFFVSGYPGTGKTFLACWLALNDVLSDDYEQEKLVIFRSAVESRKIGYLPGTAEEKASWYEKPYSGMFDNLFKGEHKRTWERLKNLGYVDFELTSNQRGVTYDNAVMIVDECQNLTFEELDTIYTRAGKNTRVIFCGDSAQNDLVHYKGQLSGMGQFGNLLEGMDSVSFHGFYEVDDIVRSGRIKDYIKRKIAAGLC